MKTPIRTFVKLGLVAFSLLSTQAVQAQFAPTDPTAPMWVPPGSEPPPLPPKSLTIRSPGGGVTAIDQSNAPADLKITQSVRQALVREQGLSLQARNVMIVTRDKTVYLKGTVASSEERRKVMRLAKANSGTYTLKSYLKTSE